MRDAVPPDAYADGLDSNSDVHQGIDDDAKSVLSKIDSDLIEYGGDDDSKIHWSKRSRACRRRPAPV